MISLILVEPEGPENIGAVARVMKNFDVTELILVKPKCNHLSLEARKRAMKAHSVLEKAKIVKAIPKMHTLIATTAKGGNDFNVSRAPLSPEQLVEIIAHKKINLGIVFGRESSGLTNEEIQQCDFCVTIPSSEKYQALNLSHAVSIVLYEIFKKNKKIKPHEKITIASEREKEQVIKLHAEVLNYFSFSSKPKKEIQQKVWKRVIGKSFLTKREAYTLMGFFKKVKQKIKP
ncbi:RNA methyltransferase [Candidatus Woesearchaeota archaeon]|nr:RNA methyltransferase [Candidatus Woesearchaeota archaeon]